MDQKDEVTEEWRKLHEEFNDLYSKPNLILVTKSRRIRWAGLIPRMEERRTVYRVLVGKPERRDHLENPDVDGRVILDGSSESMMGEWTGLIWLRIATGGGHL